DLVADFVGMAFGHGFRSKKAFRHDVALLDLYALRAQDLAEKQLAGNCNKKRPKARKPLSAITLIFRFPAGFGTLHDAGCWTSQGLFPPSLLISCYSICETQCNTPEKVCQ